MISVLQNAGALAAAGMVSYCIVNADAKRVTRTDLPPGTVNVRAVAASPLDGPLTIENFAGSVTVVASDEPEVRVVARNRSRAPMELAIITIGGPPFTTRAEVNWPRGTVGAVTVDLEVHVPRSRTSDVETYAADSITQRGHFGGCVITKGRYCLELLTAVGDGATSTR